MTELPNLDLTPNDLEAERAVLGSVLIRGHLNDVLGIVSPADMFLPAHRSIFEAMATLGAARERIDAVTVGDALRSAGLLAQLDGQDGYLLKLYDATPTAENAPHYARIVRDKARARKLVAAALDAIQRASRDTPDEVIADLRVACAGLGTNEGGPVVMADAVPPYLDVLEARQKKPEGLTISTGIRALNNVVRGHRPGQVIVIAGRPGTGKSSHAFSTVVRAARDFAVPGLFFSLEMQTEELMDRELALVTGIDGGKIQDGELNYEDWKIRVGPAATAIKSFPLSIDDRKLTIEQIVAEATRWRAKNPGLALVAVDYLGLIRSSGRAENRQQEVSGWMRELKILAGDLKVAVLVVSQLNRESVSGGAPRRPVLSDLRESGAIEQDADTVIFTWRDESISELIVAKNRGRAIGVASVVWDGPRTAYFDDLGPEPFVAGEPPKSWADDI